MPGAACRIASPSSDLMGLSLGEAAAAAAAAAATEGWAAGLASALKGLRAAQQHSPMETEPPFAPPPQQQQLAPDLLQLYVSGWRAVALSFSVAAIEWRGAVGMSSEPWVPLSRATRESLGVQFRALELRPELLHAALSLDTGADERLELLSEQLAQLLRTLLSGERLSHTRRRCSAAPRRPSPAPSCSRRPRPRRRCCGASWPRWRCWCSPRCPNPSPNPIPNPIPNPNPEPEPGPASRKPWP